MQNLLRDGIESSVILDRLTEKSTTPKSSHKRGLKILLESLVIQMKYNIIEM